MTTYEEIVKEIKTALSNGEELEDIKDRAGEWVDGYVPVYNNRVLEEWAQMPSDYDNRGAVELGYGGGDVDIIKFMMADLYIYYTDLFNEVLSDLEEELEEVTA